MPLDDVRIARYARQLLVPGRAIIWRSSEAASAATAAAAGTGGRPALVTEREQAKHGAPGGTETIPPPSPSGSATTCGTPARRAASAAASAWATGETHTSVAVGTPPVG